MADERVRQGRGTAARARPAHRMAHQVEMHGGDRAPGAPGRDVAVHRRPVQPGARAVAREQPRGERLGGREQQPRPGEHAVRAEGRQQPRRPGDRREAVHHRVAPRAEPVQVRRGERAPRRAVARDEHVQRRDRLVEVAGQRRRAPVGKRVRIAAARVHPREPVALERPACEHGRGRRGRVHRGEHVVAEAGERQLLRRDRAARRRVRLEHRHRHPRLGERDGGGEPVGPAADHDRVSVPGHMASYPGRRG